MKYFEEIRSHILDHGIVNTHAHHLSDSETAGLNLAKILERSYVSWCGQAVPSSAAGADRWIEKVGNRSFYRSLTRALQKLYSMDEPLSGAVWDEYDKRIRRAHENTQWHLEILRKTCGYNTVVQDSYWNPGDDNGHPEIFKPAFRVNYFLYGYNHTAADHNGNNAQLAYGQQINNIKDYTDFLYRVIKEKKESGCATLKSAIAYERSISVEASSPQEAQAAMGLGKTEPSAAAVKKFQDYVFDVICDIAAELKIPFQIHTGLGLLDETNPMQIQKLIKRHPDTVFILMHGGYPWVDDICGLVHVYPNVVVDLCWLPLISPSAGIRALHELLEVCNGDKIVWGCDTWTSEESWGALLSMADTLAIVLDEKINRGYCCLNNAGRIAEGIM
jgi:predicted TIM-barrel fold metal-dependent hydrolase